MNRESLREQRPDRRGRVKVEAEMGPQHQQFRLLQLVEGPAGCYQMAPRPVGRCDAADSLLCENRRVRKSWRIDVSRETDSRIRV